jgi:hypothetical protein
MKAKLCGLRSSSIRQPTNGPGEPSRYKAPSFGWGFLLYMALAALRIAVSQIDDTEPRNSFAASKASGDSVMIFCFRFRLAATEGRPAPG